MAAEGKDVHHSKSKWVFQPTEDINEHYEILSSLGQPGQYGRAVKARKRNVQVGEPEFYAVKIISKKRFLRRTKKKARSAFDSFRNEVRNMNKLNHPNVVKFYEYFETKLEFYIVMELCEGGELFDKIQEHKRFTERIASGYLRQLFEGLAYMHKMQIAHCDLKPDNFMFTKDGTLKIIDLGMSKNVKPRKYFRKFCGTPYYIAPEVLSGRYTDACDCWSMGVIMFVLLHGYPPFYADEKIYGDQADARMYELIKSGFIPEVRRGYKNHFPEKIPSSKGAKDLITKLLDQNTSTRLSAQEALEHPWMTGQGAPDKPIHVSVLRSLKQFTGVKQHRARLLTMFSDRLTDEEKARIVTTFKGMDTDNDGHVTKDELRQALAQQNSNVTEEDVKRVLDSVDVDGDGKISLNELTLPAVHRKLLAKEERMWEAFCQLDVNKDGKISAEEMQKIMTNQSLGLDLEETKKLIESFDKDGDGHVDYTEFLDSWMESQREDQAQRMETKSQLDSNHPMGIVVEDLHGTRNDQYFEEIEENQAVLEQSARGKRGGSSNAVPKKKPSGCFGGCFSAPQDD